MRRHALLVSALTASILSAGAAAAQVRTLYATDAWNPNKMRIQGGAVTQTFSGFASTYGGSDYALAVYGGTVSTLGSIGGINGTQYTTSGAVVGATAFNPFLGSVFFDGTSDGTYNYTIDYVTGNVYRAGLDWSNLSLLFSVGRSGWAGITYDRAHNSLWMSGHGGNAFVTGANRVFEYSMGGSLLSSFTPFLIGLGQPGYGASALAYDAVDQTLWMSDYSGSVTHLFQYDRAGGELAALTVTGTFNGVYLLGAEFDNGTANVVPEPSSIMLLATGLAGLSVVARRRRSIVRS